MSFGGIDWESALGLPTDSLNDDVNENSEIGISSKLYKVQLKAFSWCLD
jgi:hypothetical protein